MSNVSGLVSDITFPANQSYAFFDLRNDANYTISVEANHDNASSPNTVQLQLTSMHAEVVVCVHIMFHYDYTALIYTVDTRLSMALQHNKVIVKLNDRCKEDPTSFMTTLSYGSCPNSLQYMCMTKSSKVFNSSGVASFKLDIENVIGNVCIQVEMTHRSRPNIPLRTFEQELILNSCSIALINSVASASVTVEFSSAESSGVVPHGTIATFKPLLCADQLVGVEHATCFNGMWSDLSRRTSSCKFTINKHYTSAVFHYMHNIIFTESDIIALFISSFLVCE